MTSKIFEYFDQKGSHHSLKFQAQLESVMGKKTSLKAALLSQQTRFKKSQEIAHTALLANKKSKAKATRISVLSSPPTIPFTQFDKILLVGEGDFSFTRALVSDPPPSLEYLPAASIAATTYDDEERCYSKYPNAEQIVITLRSKGVDVIFGVDATRLDKCAPLRNRRFDKIVWNFPHAGKGIADQDRNILSNQLMLLEFFRSAAPFLRLGPAPIVHLPKTRSQDDGDDDNEARDDRPSVAMRGGDSPGEKNPPRGRILITLRNVPPYTLWDLPRLAKKPPPPRTPKEPAHPVYAQVRSYKFSRSLWKGYEHRMTKGERAHGRGKTGQDGEERTWEFCLETNGS